MADLVARVLFYSPHGVAICCLPAGMARHGCGHFSRVLSPNPPSATSGLAFGTDEDDSGNGSALGCGPPNGATGTIAQGWTGLLGLIFLLHFGSFHLLALLWQSVGVAAEPIMSNPAWSTSLSEFWGKRWNLGFRQLAHELIFQPLHKQLGVATAGFVVFVVSGMLHDLVISLPARGGYGFPTAYFVLQGLGTAVERSAIGRRCSLRQGLRGWLFLLVVTAGPVYWLFHPPFVQHVILPFMHAIGCL